MIGNRFELASNLPAVGDLNSVRFLKYGWMSCGSVSIMFFRCAFSRGKQSSSTGSPSFSIVAIFSLMPSMRSITSTSSLSLMNSIRFDRHNFSICRVLILVLISLNRASYQDAWWKDENELESIRIYPFFSFITYMRCKYTHKVRAPEESSIQVRPIAFDTGGQLRTAGL